MKYLLIFEKSLKMAENSQEEYIFEYTDGTLRNNPRLSYQRISSNEEVEDSEYGISRIIARIRFPLEGYQTLLVRSNFLEKYKNNVIWSKNFEDENMAKNYMLKIFSQVHESLPFDEIKKIYLKIPQYIADMEAICVNEETFDEENLDECEIYFLLLLSPTDIVDKIILSPIT